MSRHLSDDAAALGFWPESRAASDEGLLRPALRYLAAGLVLFGLVAAAYALEPVSRGTLSLSLVFGALFGIVLQRSRFCFACIWRDFLDERDPRGLLGVLVALGVGLTGYIVVFGAWLPDPTGSRLPPQAHIGPVGPVLALAGFCFGAGMAVSGSCISAHLYRLGEGSPTAPFALVGTALGFVAGFLAWNPLYLASVAEAPVVWLPRSLGYAGSLGLGLAALGAAALVLMRFVPDRPSPRAARDPWHTLLVERWPAWAGGLAVGGLAVAAYFRIAPLGVTAEIGARSREAADALGLLPARLEGLDALRGCATAIRDTLLTPNGVFVAALIAGSLAAALAAGQFRPAWPTRDQAARGMLGGILLGFGAMLGLGCSIGTFLSGIMAGALSGWVFAVAMFAGMTVTLLAGRRLRLLA